MEVLQTKHLMKPILIQTQHLKNSHKTVFKIKILMLLLHIFQISQWLVKLLSNSVNKYTTQERFQRLMKIF